MIRKGSNSIAVTCWIVLCHSFVLFPPVPSTYAEGRIFLIGEASSDAPICEEFFDRWEIPGVPPAMLAMGGLGSELMAAYDCVQKKDLSKACEHWMKLLAVMDKMGSPLDESRSDVEKLMDEHKCAAAARASDAKPAPKIAPGPGSVPAQSAPSTGP